MSPASTATSVPAPIAIPTSAVTSAGASLTPSPTIATRFPLRRKRLDDLRLAVGEHLRVDGVDPELSRHRLGDRPGVAGEHRDLEPHRRGAAGPPPPTRASPRRRPRTPRSPSPPRRGRRRTGRAPPPRARTRRARAGGATRSRRSRFGPPTSRSRPSTTRAHAVPGDRLEPLRLRDRDATLPGGAHHRLRDGVLGVALDRGGDAERILLGRARRQPARRRRGARRA